MPPFLRACHIYVLSTEHGEISSESSKKKDVEIKYYHIDEEISRIICFCRSVEVDFHRLAESRNVDLKYDVLCLCRVYLLESGEVKG